MIQYETTFLSYSICISIYKSVYKDRYIGDTYKRKRFLVFFITASWQISLTPPTPHSSCPSAHCSPNRVSQFFLISIARWSKPIDILGNISSNTNNRETKKLSMGQDYYNNWQTIWQANLGRDSHIAISAHLDSFIVVFQIGRQCPPNYHEVIIACWWDSMNHW